MKIGKNELEDKLAEFNFKFGRNPTKAEYGVSGGHGLPPYTTAARLLGYYPKSEPAANKIRDSYDRNPKHCKQCGLEIEYSRRFRNFCSSSCSATYNNKRRANKDTSVYNKCACCDKPLKLKTQKFFCSVKCHRQYLFAENLHGWLFGRPAISSKTAKSFIIHLFGYTCSCCGISEWNGSPLVLELEHKDGNSDNNFILNLCLLCPNCHSQTPTYKAKNKGNGRKYRRDRYKDGKSY